MRSFIDYINSWLQQPRFGVLLFVLCSNAIAVYAQYDAAFMRYWQVEPQLNPAAVGRQEELNVTIAMQTHASGYEDAGSTLYAGADIAFALGNTRHGVGLTLVNDEIGLFSHKRFSAQYAYHHPLWGGKLAGGLQLDMLSESVDGGKAETNDPNDPVFSSGDMSGSQFDASVGLFYTHRRWYAGLAMQHLSAPTISLGEKSELKVNSAYNFMAGYNIPTKYSFITLTPSVLLRYDGTDFRTDLTARIKYDGEGRTMYGGVNYAPQYSIGAFFGFVFHGLDICYGYEANTNGMGIAAGNHEITLGYKVELNLGKRGRNMHKSVRWL
ncbi:MAG: PorP/SprF family type IX secretion system membrane protein [Bacteroidaceae bacterium]|jgi:type IX secretion system PorP/SprF family membrane protein|nr:PorP/SprF family type IX secretion system membrane protein [Bacteroidaceae bacterium]